jgi:DNA-binding transcriptional MerR regulator
VTNGQVVIPGFDDGKEPGALRTIGEVAKTLGIRQHVLRYWEEQFPMVSPVKRSGGRRYYRPEDVRLIAMIDRLVHREGYTLRGARQAIRSAGIASFRAEPEPEPVPRQALAPETVDRLEAIRRDLAAALAES